VRTRRLAAAAAIIGALSGPTGAQAASCNDRANIRQKDPNASLAVGDSVMLAAAEELAAYGFAVDAQACRQMDQGLVVMQQRSTLPSLVVVALGSNANVTADQVRGVLELVGPFGRAIFVLPRALGGGPDPDGRVFRAAERAFPDQVSILDWPAYSEGHPDWLASDGLHLTGTGAKEFARFIAEAPELGPQPEEIEPPPPVEPKRPKPPKPPPPAPDPLVRAMWHHLGRTLAVVFEPPLRLLAQLVSRSEAKQDL
jgi:hypothetical protein